MGLLELILLILFLLGLIVVIGAALTCRGQAAVGPSENPVNGVMSIHAVCASVIVASLLAPPPAAAQSITDPSVPPPASAQPAMSPLVQPASLFPPGAVDPGPRLGPRIHLVRSPAERPLGPGQYRLSSGTVTRRSGSFLAEAGLGAVGSVVGLLAGGSIGASGADCRVWESSCGLDGAIVGAGVGSVAGSALGAQFGGRLTGGAPSIAGNVLGGGLGLLVGAGLAIAAADDEGWRQIVILSSVQGTLAALVGHEVASPGSSTR